MTRRNTELMLLIIAAPIVIILFGSLVVANGGELSINTLGVPLGIFAAFVGAHLAMRRFAENTDPAILPITFALSGIGIAYVTRLAPDLAVRQVVWLFLGIACMVAALVFLRKIEKVANYKYTLIIIGVLLLLSPLLPVVGTEIYGSRSSSCSSLPATWRKTARCSRCSPCAWGRCACPTSAPCCRYS